MKTLFISDLDGTLLNRNAELSEYTVQALNKLIGDGVYFSVATARTGETSLLILRDVAVNVPVILMNGILIFDLETKRYIKKELLTREKAEKIFTAMKKVNQTGLMYTLSGDQLITFYEGIGSDAIKHFIRERIEKYGKVFTQIDDFAHVVGQRAEAEIVSFCFLDSSENIHGLYDEIKEIGGLRMEKYQDIYSQGDCWYMEVFSETASKYEALQFLRRQYGFDHIVSFGDNLNDIPMFEASDECYAVENAKPEVKERATGMIESNNNDGVVKFIIEKQSSL